MRKGENFRRISERDGPFAGGVKGGEEEDEGRHKAKVSLGRVWDKEAETCSEESPGHVGECEEKQSAAPISVDGPYGGEGEEKVYESKLRTCC